MHLPHRMGFNGEAGVTSWGGADYAGWGRRIEKCSDWNICAECSNWNILYRQERKYRDVCIMLVNETIQGG
jgi:hypothetical protein